MGGVRCITQTLSTPFFFALPPAAADKSQKAEPEAERELAAHTGGLLYSRIFWASSSALHGPGTTTATKLTETNQTEVTKTSRQVITPQIS